MSWDRAPIYGADIQAWFFVRQYYHAIGEKHCALFGNFRWPQYNAEYDSGTITAVIGGSGTFELIDDTKDWSGFPLGCSGTSRWFNVTCSGDPNTPPFYDIVIEAGGTEDETMIVRGQIVGGASDSVLVPDSIVDYVTAGIINDVSDLIGKRYAIIRRSGLYWSDKDDDKSRWPAWPNGFPSQEQIASDYGELARQEVWRGEVNSAREFSLTDLTDRMTNRNCVQFVPGALQKWGVDRWKDYELLVYREDGYLFRSAILGNSRNTLFLDVPTYELTIGGTIGIGDLFTLSFETADGITDITIEAESTTASDVAEQIALELLASLDPILVALSLDTSASGATLTISASAGWFIVTPTTTEDDGSPAVGQTFVLDPADESENVAQGQYSIVEAGARAFPGRTSDAVGKPFWWYGGATEPYVVHYPDDQRVPLEWPVANVFFEDGSDPLFCTGEETSHPAFDIDAWIPGDNVCDLEGRSDYFFGPHLFKTGRQRQNVIEGLVPQFSDLDRVETNPRTKYVVATALDQAGVNNQDTTITGFGSGVATIGAITIPKETPGAAAPSSRPVYFAIIDDDDSVLLAGSGTATTTTLSASGIGSEHIGKELVLSFGWSRHYPRQFGRYYPQGVFIPDVDITDEGEEIIDPPRVVSLGESGCFGVGSWIRRERSANYQEYSEMGFAGDNGSAFITNEYARYVGTHWAQPDVGFGPAGSMTIRAEDASLDLPYWDHFTVSRHLPAKQTVIEESKSGRATNGGKNWLQDDEKDWYSSVWYTDSMPSGDTPRTETGVATDGSKGQIVDSHKTNSVLFETHCFWQTSRFIGFDGAYVGFPIKVQQTRDGETIEWRSFITNTFQGPGYTVIDFEQIAGMPEVETGDTYAIDEPYEVNRWENRGLRITKPDGTIIETIITHSDDKTLFFDDLDGGATVEAGDAYSIIEVMPGTVHKWTGSDWVEPLAGSADPRGPTPGRSDDGIFRSPTTLNLPTIVTAFGRIRSFDYSGLPDDEMYRVLNLLYRIPYTGWTWLSCLCIHSGDTCPSCDNDVPNYNFGSDIGQNTYGDLQSALAASWADPGHLFPPSGSHIENGQQPFAYNNIHGTVPTSPGDVEHSLAGIEERSFSHAVLTDIRTCMLSSVEYWVYTTIDLADHPESDVTTSGNRVIFHFNANGDNVNYRAWGKIGTGSAEATATRVGPRLGSLAEPNDTPDPTPGIAPTHTVESTAGYVVQDWVSVLDFSPGMKYLDV